MAKFRIRSQQRHSTVSHDLCRRALVVMTLCCIFCRDVVIVNTSAFVVVSSNHYHRPSATLQHTKRASTALYGIVIDPPSSSSSSSSSSFRRDEEDEDSSAADTAWTPSANGGFFANIPQQIRLLRQKRKGKKATAPAAVQDEAPLPSKGSASDSSSITTPPLPHEESSGMKSIQGIPQVTDLVQYKQHVVDVQNYDFVAVRFYAPWCKACRAVERPFRRLPKEFDNDHQSSIKFVEVPVTKDNAYLHQGLGIPSLPFAHIYQVNHGDGGSTLVEEMKINKNVFGTFKQTLEHYVRGECPMIYDDEVGDMVAEGGSEREE